MFKETGRISIDSTTECGVRKRKVYYGYGCESRAIKVQEDRDYLNQIETIKLFHGIGKD